MTVVTGIEALTRSDDGTLVIPEDREAWREWVSATKARNWLNDDPLLGTMGSGATPRRTTTTRGPTSARSCSAGATPSRPAC